MRSSVNIEILLATSFQVANSIKNKLARGLMWYNVLQYIACHLCALSTIALAILHANIAYLAKQNKNHPHSSKCKTCTK